MMETSGVLFINSFMYLCFALQEVHSSVVAGN